MFDSPTVILREPNHRIYDRLVPPYIIGEPTGHRSYAHTAEKAADAFAHTNDPLSNHASWTAESGGSYTTSDGSKVVLKAPGASLRLDAHSYDHTPASADYSVEMTLTPNANVPSNSRIDVTVRQQAGANTHYGAVYQRVSAGWVVVIVRRIAGTPTDVLSQQVIGLTPPQTIRLEIVGFALTLYYNGEANFYSVTDSHASKISGAGKGGLQGVGIAGASVMATGDNWRLLEAQTFNPATFLRLKK